MSAIAECIVVERAKLDAFVLGGSWETLVEGAPRFAYNGSGYVLATLLPYLDEQGLTFESSYTDKLPSDSGVVCVLGVEHQRFLDQLDAKKYDASALREYYEAFNETSAPGVETAMLGGIRFFRAAIQQLQDSQVALVTIC